jgi:hypothetical protein
LLNVFGDFALAPEGASGPRWNLEPFVFETAILGSGAMPTESSAVASLIRDLNTHRLPSEPGFVDLFHDPARDKPRAQQPARQPQATRAPQPQAREPERAPQTRSRPAVASPSPQASIAQKVAAKSKAPARATSTGAWKGWLQLALGTLVIGAWGYLAAQLDPYGESRAVAAPPPAVTAIAPAMTPVAPPAPPAPTVTPIETPAPPTAAIAEPTVAPAALVSEPAEPVAPEATAAPAETPKKKQKKRRVAKAKSVAKASKATSEVAEKKAVKPSSDEKKAAEAPPPKPAVEAPAKPAPRRVQQQADDSENPLK